MAIHREMTLGTRSRRWLAQRWNFNRLLGVISLTLCALVWQFASALAAVPAQAAADHRRH